MNTKLENFIEELKWLRNEKEISNKDFVVGDLLILPVCCYGPAIFWGTYLDSCLSNPDLETSYFLARIVEEEYECGRNSQGKYMIHKMRLEIENSSDYGEVVKYILTNALAVDVYNSAIKCYSTDNDEERRRKLMEKHQRAKKTEREWFGENQPESLLVSSSLPEEAL